jgi:hypothetical protein
MGHRWALLDVDVMGWVWMHWDGCGCAADGVDAPWMGTVECRWTWNGQMEGHGWLRDGQQMGVDGFGWVWMSVGLCGCMLTGMDWAGWGWMMRMGDEGY